MNTKYLFGMLLGGAMLAACSTEDDFNFSQKSEVDPSAPVFTVSFEDNGVLKTRAHMNGWNVGFDETDKLSLFHGVTPVTTSGAETFRGWQNAVYSSDNESGEGTYSTKSIVNPGCAVLVYPADTEFNNNLSGNLGEGEPAIVIPTEQDNKTKTLTPYMSEILEITSTGKNAAGKNVGKAGYEEKYDIDLKRVGSILSLKMNITESDELAQAIASTGVPAIEIKKVELNSGEDCKSFTAAISVIAKEAEPAGKNNHPSWIKVSDLNTEKAPEKIREGIDAEVQKISTTDIENNTATFTLLPVIGDMDKAPKKPWNSEVVIYTTYGKVVVGPSKTKAWQGNSTVGAGLRALLTNDVLWAPYENSKFVGENIGGHLNRNVAVDMHDLDMNGLHVATGAELVNALKVYEAYCEGEKVEILLDGTKDVFSMTEEQLNEVKRILDKKETDVTLTPCTEPSEKCTTIKITTGSGKEIPNLSFGGSVKVQLAGDWKYTSVVDKAKDLKVFNSVSELEMVDGTLTVDNRIGSTNKVLKITIANAAKVDVVGDKVVLDVNMDNQGTINIPSGKTFRLDNEVTLTNLESKTKTSGGRTAAGAGKIIIGADATLGAVNETGAKSKIYNYGVIEADGAANILITSQMRTSTTMQGTFEHGKVAIGIIDLGESLGDAKRINVKDAAKEDGTLDRTKLEYGFVKTRIKTTKGTLVEAYGEVANYIILKEGSDCVDNTNTEYNKKFAKVPDYVKYIEIASGKQVSFEGTFDLNGLIVDGKEKAFVGQKNTLKVSDAYIKGEIINGGTLTITSYNGYFGGKADDKDNITTLPGASTN